MCTLDKNHLLVVFFCSHHRLLIDYTAAKWILELYCSSKRLNGIMRWDVRLKALWDNAQQSFPPSFFFSLSLLVLKGSRRGFSSCIRNSDDLHHLSTCYSRIEELAAYCSALTRSLVPSGKTAAEWRENGIGTLLLL